MNTDQLHDALDMLKLSDDKFLVEVSRAISPKPWPHLRRVGDVKVRCVRCDRHWISHRAWMEDDTDCPVPPLITESLADVTEALRKKATINGRANLFKAVYHTMKNVTWPDMTSWWFDAPFKERIACCLVALGYWQVNKEKEKS